MKIKAVFLLWEILIKTDLDSRARKGEITQFFG